MLAPQLLRTRVARRILTVFLLCAILPVATFALLAYHLTAARLQRDARDGLRQGSKTAGMIVMNRLQAIVSELGSSEAGSSYEATALELQDGRLEPQRGTIARVPALSSRQIAHLGTGSPVVLTETVGNTPRIFVILPNRSAPSGYPRRWGIITPEVILGANSTLNPAPDGTELCLLTTDGRPLECPSLEAAAALSAAGEVGDAAPTWQRGDSTFLVARWELFLGAEFGSPSWTVALSMPHSAVLVPLASFRRTFVLGVALAAVLVFVLSHIQLRKRMTPLAELEAGARRLGAGDFTTPMVVRSNDEFEMLAGSFNTMASDLRNQFMTLTALRSVDVAALETRSAIAIANAALRWAPGLLEGNRAAVAFASTAEPGVWTVLSAAPDDSDRREGRASLLPGELLHLEAALDVVHFAAGSPGHGYFGAEHLSPDTPRLVFPLRQNGRIQAALAVARRDDSPFPATIIARGRQLADQLAVGLSNAWLLGELDALSHGSMLALARTIDAASPWTAGHSERVTQGALEIGRRLGLDRLALDRLRRGGLLHDIGKIGVPAAILDKPKSLTAEERKVIESHPVIGAEIIKPIAAFRELRPLVLYHHELLDGSGYPDGLSGDAIPTLVRVLTVADIFDALVSDRPYRAGLTPVRALSILREGAGRKYDERAVQALEEAVRGGWSATAIANPALLHARVAGAILVSERIVSEEVFT